MSLSGSQSVLPPPSQPSRITYGQTANIDAVNSSKGYDIDLTTTEIGAFLATVPCVIRITPASSTQAVWIKNTSGNQSMNCVVQCVGGTIDRQANLSVECKRSSHNFYGRWQRQPHHQLNEIGRGRLWTAAIHPMRRCFHSFCNGRRSTSPLP
jgi:hypothetical protein